MEKIEKVQEKIGELMELVNDYKVAFLETLGECENLMAQLYEEQESKEKELAAIEEKKEAQRQRVKRYRLIQKEKMKQLEAENKRLKEEK